MKRTFFCLALIFLAVGLAICPAWSQSVTILHSFNDGSVANDGISPQSGLVLGPDGNFYGTTYWGGAYPNVDPDGVVYKITPSGEETILHSFPDPNTPDDGTGPWAGLILGSDGNFYGTTLGWGSTIDSNPFGYGTIFRITPSGSVTTLHSFNDGSVANDGYAAYNGVIQGKDGNFYGTAQLGGTSGDGEFFRMTPTGQVTILHSFSGSPDGSTPIGALIQDRNPASPYYGDFYGVTQMGGDYYGGVVYRMTPTGDETILHAFGDWTMPNDGLYPAAGLTFGQDGDLYGTTMYGGSTISQTNYYGSGTVYKITPAGDLAILHSFGDGSVHNDGAEPIASLVLGTDGNFYGTTGIGGSTVAEDPNGFGFGVVFEITPSGQISVPHFFGDGSVADDGKYPAAMLIEDSDGSIYGTTQAGGTAVSTNNPYGAGTVYKLTPAAMLNINPLAVAGGKTITATLNVYSPVATKTLVRLSCSDPSAATVKQTIYISAGHSTVTFSIQTQPVAANENVTITAQLPTAIVPSGSVSGTFAISAPQLTSVQLDESSVPGGGWVNGTVNLSSAAPAGGETVALSSVNNSYGAVTGFLSSPPGTDGSESITSVMVPAGAPSAQFVIQTKAVPKTASVTVRGTLDGTSRGAALAVTPPPAT